MCFKVPGAATPWTADWLAHANHAGHENGFDYLGGSKVVAPDGTIVTDAGAEECLVTAEIRLDAIKAARARLPYLRDCSRLRD